MTLVFFYPQLRKLTGAERLILKLADYTARQLGAEGEVVLLTHRFVPECRPALAEGVRLIETGWPMQPTGNHYLDAAVEYALGPALALRIPRQKAVGRKQATTDHGRQLTQSSHSPLATRRSSLANGVVFFGPPSVPAMWFARRVLFPILGKRVPLLYFCFEPPRFIYSDTGDIVARLGSAGRVLEPMFKLYRRLDRKMVGAAHRVLSNSPYGSRRILDAYGRRATVIEHGVDFPLPMPAEVESLRRRYGLEGRSVAVTVNHLHPRKRIDLFLQAMSIVMDRVPGAVASVVGEGPERVALEQEAEQLGMEIGRDVVFTGAVPEAELPAHYALANVYAHTGREESFGLSVIEALKLGVPVVSVAEGGPLHTVQDGVSGYLVPPTPDGLGDALARLMSEPKLAKKMGREGAAFVERRFRWERGAQTLLRVLGEVSGRLRHV